MRGPAVIAVIAVVVVAGACERFDSDETAQVALQQLEAPPSHVDSVFPIEEEVRRMREQLGGGGASVLAGGASSAEELAARYVEAIEQMDRGKLALLTLTPLEFLDLYYPHTRFVNRPYELSPQLVWFQLENSRSKEMGRALERFSGRALGYRGYECADDVMEGPNRILGRCTLRLEGGEALSLPGRMMGRDGHWKLF
jgi:hypothetical protein